MSLLCRIGLHAWEETPVITAEDYVRLTCDADVCRRCGKVGDLEMAREAYFMIIANFRTKTVKITTHPALGLTRDAAESSGDPK